jgi:hypothetical protein
MAKRLVLSPGYKADRKKILDSIISYALENDEDARPILTFFRKEEKALQQRIVLSPLSAGVDFPAPVKKATSNSGKYIVLYACLPPESSTNDEVKQVNLNSILASATDEFNRLVNGFLQADVED